MISFTAPEGICLNNPMNIEKNGIAWVGEANMQDNPKFVRFETPEMGIRAGMKILITYQRKYELEHISAIINKYAPPLVNGKIENDTEAYIDDVCQRCGVGPTDFFDVEVPDNLIRLTQAIVVHEQGHCPDTSNPFWYADSLYESAASAALA